MRILIAEDDNTSSKFLYDYLSSYGECDITVDGIETIDAFIMAIEDNEPYDLICLDIMMPKVDGIRVLKAIRKIENEKKINESKKVKVIVTTALNESNTIIKCQEAGCQAYMAKPINADELIEIIKKLEIV